MAGVEGLQEVGGFAAAHFADHDVIGSVAEGVLHQIADRDRAVLQLFGVSDNRNKRMWATRPLPEDAQIIGEVIWLGRSLP